MMSPRLQEELDAAAKEEAALAPGLADVLTQASKMARVDPEAILVPTEENQL